MDIGDGRVDEGRLGRTTILGQVGDLKKTGKILGDGGCDLLVKMGMREMIAFTNTFMASTIRCCRISVAH
jgi:hypothetical protein